MNYVSKGTELRLAIKELVFDYMKNSPDCAVYADGLKQAEIFRQCGLDWGEYPNATSSNQQYWIVALLRELESEGKAHRDVDSQKCRSK